MKKHLVFLVIILGLVSLACLSTAKAGNIAGAPDPTATGGGASAAETPISGGEVSIETTATTLQCVSTSAAEAQNLRESPSIDGDIVGALYPDQVWIVLDQSAADWWQVLRGDSMGWARREYLSKKECKDG